MLLSQAGAASLHGLHLYWARQAEQILASYPYSWMIGKRLCGVKVVFVYLRTLSPRDHLERKIWHVRKLY